MYEVKSYRTDHGVKTVLVGPSGRKYMPILMMECAGLIVKKVPLSEQRYLRDVVETRKRSRSLKATIRLFRAFGKRVGMTKAAKSFLTQAFKAA